MSTDDTSPVPAHLLRAIRKRNKFSTANQLSEKAATVENSKTGPLAASPSDPKPASASLEISGDDAPAGVQAGPKAPRKNLESNPTKRGGRPTDPDSFLPRVFDNQNQCSGVTGIPVPVLKAAKKAGCPAFRHSRVDLVAFLKWRFAQADDAVDDWGTELKKFQAQREKIKLDNDRGLVVGRAVVSQATGKGMATVCAAIERLFGNTLPPALTGLSAPEIQARLMKEYEKIKADLRRDFSVLSSTPTPPATNQVEKVNNENINSTAPKPSAHPGTA